ncbi:MAG: hypothetical protein ACKPJJ_05635, partial [Planctomycetaceae bacterium]
MLVTTLVASFMAFATAVAFAVTTDETVSLTPVQDNSIVMVDREWSENAGSNGRIRIKGNQHIVAFDFDFTPLKGRRVKSARLICTQASETIEGVTISTIAVPWNEQKSSALTSGTVNQNGWGTAGVRFPSVCGGNAFTLVHQSNQSARNGVYTWDIAPDLIHANILGIAYGLAVHEHSADYSRNPTIYSREQSGKAPRLELELEATAETAPGSPQNLQVNINTEGLPELSFTAPKDGFAWELTVDGVPLPRVRIPLLQPDTRQVIVLPELQAGDQRPAAARIALRALNRNGESANWTVLETVRVRPPARLQIPPQRTVAGPAASGLQGLAVIPVCDRCDQSGMAVGDLP